MKNLFLTLLASACASLTLGAPAAPSTSILTPKVLPQEIEGFRLLATNEKTIFWVPTEVRDYLAATELNFIDITEFTDADPSKAPAKVNIPASPSHQSVVNPLIAQIDTALYEKNLIYLSNTFRNRYYTSDTGVASAEWIFNLVTSTAANRTDITITKFAHAFKQPSIIARIAGTAGNNAVILGAHQDSTAPSMPTGLAPGADDDGSGSIGIYEIFRILATNNFRPQNPIEFHWYAAEEVGLLGSQGVARDYSDRAVPVRSMMQLDMIAYNKRESAVGIITDYVDPETIEFNRKLVDEYLQIGWANSVCGYGCSDHASWDRYGYRSSFPFEAQFGNRNPLIHTTQDTMAQVSVTHAAEFIKLGLAFAVELSYN